MGDRKEATINVTVKGEFIEKINIEKHTSDGLNVEREDYNLSFGYHCYNKTNETISNKTGNSETIHLDKPTPKFKELKSDIVEFVNKNQATQEYKIGIIINGAQASYEDLGKTLDKYEKIWNTKKFNKGNTAGVYINVNSQGNISTATIDNPLEADNTSKRTTYTLSSDGKEYSSSTYYLKTKTNNLKTKTDVVGPNIKVEDLAPTLTKYILSNNEEHEMDLVIFKNDHHNDVNYQEFCEALKKNEVLHHVQGMHSVGVKLSNSSNHSKGLNNLPTNLQKE